MVVSGQPNLLKEDFYGVRVFTSELSKSDVELPHHAALEGVVLRYLLDY